jgi:hypothetical protein
VRLRYLARVRPAMRRHSSGSGLLPGEGDDGVNGGKIDPSYSLGVVGGYVDADFLENLNRLGTDGGRLRTVLRTGSTIPRSQIAIGPMSLAMAALSRSFSMIGSSFNHFRIFRSNALT